MDPPPELKAMAVQVGPHDMVRLGYGRGPFQLFFLLMWSEMVAHQERMGMVRATARLMSAERRLAPALSRLPLETAADNLGGDGAPWFREWVSGVDPDGPLWDPYRASSALQRVSVPTLLVGGGRRSDLSRPVVRLVENGDAAPLRSWLAAVGVRLEKPVRLV